MIAERWNKLRETIAHADPRLVDMFDFHRQRDCGTAHCIAGWADVLANESTPLGNVYSLPADQCAVEWLTGTSVPQDFEALFDPIWKRLFLATSWEEDTLDLYYDDPVRAVLAQMDWWKANVYDKDIAEGRI